MISTTFLLGLLILVSRMNCSPDYSKLPVENATGKNKKCNSSSEEPFYYWRVTNHPKEVFLYGTIHVPFLKVWSRLPNFLENQISRSDLVFFELDLLDNEIKRKLLDCQLLPSGEHLKDYLPEQLYRRLKAFFRTKRNEIEDKMYYDLLTRSWKFKKLIWILFLLNFLIENDGFYRIPAIDNLINLRAKRLHKVVRSIETVEDQCGPLNSLDSSQVVNFLNLTLEAFETAQSKGDSFSKQKNGIDLLIEQYKCGQLNSSLHSFLGQELKDWRNGNTSSSSNDGSGNRISRDKNESDKQKIEESINYFFQKQLIEQRNKKISATISEELKRNADKNMLFVIGSAHFLGSGLNSVLKSLEVQYGYQIEKVNPKKMTNFVRPPTIQGPSLSGLWWLRRTHAVTGNPVHGFERSSADGYSNSHLFDQPSFGSGSAFAFADNQTVYPNLINSRMESIRKSYNNFWLYFKLLN